MGKCLLWGGGLVGWAASELPQYQWVRLIYRPQDHGIVLNLAFVRRKGGTRRNGEDNVGVDSRRNMEDEGWRIAHERTRRKVCIRGGYQELYMSVWKGGLLTAKASRDWSFQQMHPPFRWLLS